jgi:hypothetical protein
MCVHDRTPVICISLIAVVARALLIETLSQARRPMVGRERFDLQTLDGGYASVGRKLGFARFAISQIKFPRANYLFRTLRKEKKPDQAIAST